MEISRQSTVTIDTLRATLGAILISGGLFAISALAQQAMGAEYAIEDNSEEHRYRPGELLVKFKPNVANNLAQTISVSQGAVEVKAFRRPRRLSSSPMDQWRLIRLPVGASTEQALQQFAKHPDVEHVEFNYAYTADQDPNDENFPLQWALNNTGQTGGLPGADIDALKAWNEFQTGSESVVVAVIDSGVDYTHSDLVDNIWTNPGEIAGNGEDDDGNGFVDDMHGWDFANDDNDPFDDRGHGTRVTGVIAAKGNNSIGIAGVSWDVSIMALKFLNEEGSGYTSDAVASVLYSADMGAHVMNNSWGGGSFSTALRDAISTANDAGALFIASAGNSSEDSDDEPHYPSGYDVANVIAVAATDDEDELSSSSNYGLNSVDLGAPGVAIITTNPNDDYTMSSGTSIATPHVSGAAALVIAQSPSLPHLDVKQQILNTVDTRSSLAGITVTGGRLNVFQALGGIYPDNLPPIADAGPDQTVAKNSVVLLDATASTDPDGNIVSYAWQQVEGNPPIALDNAAEAVASFIAPNVGAKPKVWVFEVTVTDNYGETARDRVTITVVKQ